jgi:hypothetical protein
MEERSRSESPAFRYYSSLEGSWRGALRPTAAGKRRVAGLAIDVATKIVPYVWMSTTLEAKLGGFFHTTKITRGGITLFQSSETMTIGDDGQTVTMAGEQRQVLGRYRPYTAEATVDRSAMRATYRIPWGGATVIQNTQIVPDGLEVTQELPWLRNHVLLTRVLT